MFEKLATMDDVQPIHLDLFDHQVSGHNLILRYDDTTLCKSLTPREHRFYENLPDELKEFVPEYRGVIEVQIDENSEGYITLLGHPQELCDTLMNDTRQSHDLDDAVSSASGTGSEAEVAAAPKTNVIRLLHNGNVEVNTKDNSSWHKKSVNPWGLKCHREHLSKLSRVGQDVNKCKFILLENVVAQFEHPCILDLKMGTRQHGDDASEQKREMQIKKCAATTSKCLGMRLGGMQVFQPKTGTYITHDKYYGRSLNSENFHQALHQFLHNGYELRTSLIEQILQRLEKLCQIIRQQDTFRFYSSSLLILYDGAYDKAENNTEPSDSNSIPSSADTHSAGQTEESKPSHSVNNTQEKLDVRMIDFSHATFDGFNDDLVHTGPHSGYLFGLENLIRMFRELQAGNS